MITLGEVERGIEMQREKDPGFATALRGWIGETEAMFADRIVPFGAAEARVWGRLSARLGHTGADLLIAATAEVHRLGRGDPESPSFHADGRTGGRARADGMLSG